MLPDLCLAPYEVRDLAPDEPLCAPADWRVKTSWFGGETLVRPVEFEGDKCTLVARHQGQRDAPLLRLNTSHRATRLLGNDELIQNDIRHSQFERRLAFDENGCLVKATGQTRALLHLHFTGQTFWINDREERFRFVWRGARREHRFNDKWRARATDNYIEREIGEMLADSDGDCAFAWTWLHRSHGERQSLLYSVARGSIDEVKALLRAICLEGARELPDADWHLLLDIAAGAGTEYYAGGASEIVNHSFLSGDHQTRRLSPRQVRLATLVLQHFELWRNWNAQIYTLVQERWRYGDGYWQIPFSAPTAHQRLEAQLQIRDFLRDKVTPTELAELMPR